MENVAQTINGLFGLGAIIGGAFCRRLRTAAIVGLLISLAYAALILAAVGGDFTNIDIAEFVGRLVGAALAFVVFAILAHYARRGIAALFRRKQA
jgi:peptidoglycan/LPS O-acetylase OafA/YrhL